MEKEDQSRKLNLLDVTIINTGAGKYEFKIHRKNGMTNVQIKSHSYVKLLPNSYSGVYKLSCDCGGEYLGETKKCVSTRSIEYQEDSMAGK